MLRVEFHCHTIYSKDSLTRPEHLVSACRKKQIDRVVITDHNTIAGAQAAWRLAPDLVVIGEEIMTTQGELLAAYVKEEIPAGLTPEAAIQSLRDQGAFISVSHPYDTLRNGHWQPEILLEILPQVDAIEVFNARCMDAKFNQRAQAFASQNHILGTVGSDAHTAFELGRATLLLPEFHDAASLKLVLESAIPETHLSSPFVHFTSRYAVWRKKLAH